MLTNIFLQLVSAYTADKTLANNLWLEIFTHYSEPKRHYHTIAHLEHMIADLQDVKEQIDDWDTLLFSIFYHDIVYDPSSSTNEKDSADIAMQRLTEIGYPLFKTEKCVRMILATKAHEVSADNDTNFLLDADLSILGASAEDYLTYSQQIREEFSIYPDFLYDRGRKKVLKRFLQRETLYTSPEFQNRYEVSAHKNICAEIDFLNT